MKCFEEGLKGLNKGCKVIITCPPTHFGDSQTESEQQSDLLMMIDLEVLGVAPSMEELFADYQLSQEGSQRQESLDAEA